MAAIIIVGMRAASSPKMLTTIGMPRMTKLLRKMACAIEPRLRLSFSNQTANAIEARNSSVTAVMPKTTRLGSKPSSKSAR